MKHAIAKVIGRQVIDSRGNPTVEADVVLENGIVGRCSVPSGASTGKYEAVELRDDDKSRYCGMGVATAVGHINGVMNDALAGRDPTDIYGTDAMLLELDGTENKSKLGANAILAVSVASAKAAARSLDVELYEFLGGATATRMPVPMMNILNGGAHAANTVDVQEFMIMPIGAESFSEGLRMCTEVYRRLRELLKSKGLATAVGDEGGFAPNLASDEHAVQNILEAIKQAGYKEQRDFVIAIDAAASEWKSGSKGKYVFPKAGGAFTSDELIEHWKKLTDEYPIYSLEDGLDEEDWTGWKKLTDRLGAGVQLVGDDLFVTNPKRLATGIQNGCANSVLVKLNQIGSLTETMETVELAHRNGYTAVISHRSGETEDTTIADLAVALGTGQIKTGAPCRSERTAKYNRLLRIEQRLGKHARYTGESAFRIKM